MSDNLGNQSFNQKVLDPSTPGLLSGLVQFLPQTELVALIADYIAQLQLSELAVSTINRYSICLRIFANYIGSSALSEYTAKTFLGKLPQSNSRTFLSVMLAR